MTVYRVKKGCKGCQMGSCYQKDHNHMILDSMILLRLWAFSWGVAP